MQAERVPESAAGGRPNDRIRRLVSKHNGKLIPALDDFDQWRTLDLIPITEPWDMQS